MMTPPGAVLGKTASMGDLLLTPRISPERAQPQFPSSLNATTTQVDATVKMKVSLPNSRPLNRRMDSSMEPLVLIDIIVVIATVKVIVVVLMGEFLRGIVVAPVVSVLILAASTFFTKSTKPFDNTADWRGISR